jgi:hypothetical protein
MSRAHVHWTGGGDARVVSIAANTIVLRSTVPAPPGSRLDGTVDAEGTSIALRIKVHASRRVVRTLERSERADHTDDVRTLERSERADHTDDARTLERSERADHTDDVRTLERSERADHTDDVRTLERSERADHTDDVRTLERSERADHKDDDKPGEGEFILQGRPLDLTREVRQRLETMIGKHDCVGGATAPASPPGPHKSR